MENQTVVLILAVRVLMVMIAGLLLVVGMMGVSAEARLLPLPLAGRGNWA